MSNRPLGLSWLLLAGVLAVPMHAAASDTALSELPPLVEPSTGEHREGKIVWADLVTPDVEAAKTFYGGIFGWTFRNLDARPKDYTLALLQGAPVAGLVQRSQPPGERHQPAWLTFLSVEDVENARRTALAHGAKELTEPRNYPRRGRQVMLADPQGAVFAILQSISGDPPDVLPNPGEWIWSALLTRDPDTDAAFYQTLFGYEVFDAEGADETSHHLVFATDGYARASCNSFPHEMTKPYPHWVNYVRVANIAQTTAKVTQLGGHVLVAPHPGRDGVPEAVVADPAGAPIGLLEWSEAQEKRADGPRGPR